MSMLYVAFSEQLHVSSTLQDETTVELAIKQFY